MTDIKIDSTRAPARIGPLPPSRIAEAARAFGDEYPMATGQTRQRVAGTVLLLGMCVYVPWVFLVLDRTRPFIAWLFFAATLLSTGSMILTVVTSWSRRVPVRRPVTAGNEPHVAVIIPTCKEPVGMILRTVESVLDQDWPAERLTIVVSDDGHELLLRDSLAGYPVIYHEPVDRWAPGRDGAAKAGNLNDALAMLDREFPDLEFIETRDADDEIGSRAFLRQAVGQLVHDERMAYVQTIKEAQVSPGDPFINREPMFYRGQMLARNATNSVFPCGSGLVWRRAALRDIGGFPVWNLVEDLQSGLEALRRGWHGCFLPIVGAVGQHAPEDVPNVFKQRGTWAVDTVRLLVWGDKRGLDRRQHLSFLSLLLFYLQSFALATFMTCVVTSFLGYAPISSDQWSGFAILTVFAAMTEGWLLVTMQPYNDRRRRQRSRLLDLWRVRVLWSGMAPVYMRGAILAVFGGRHRKPIYKVTRKTGVHRWHWEATMPHMMTVAVLVGSAIYSIVFHTIDNPAQLALTSVWGTLYLSFAVGFVMRGWHGSSPIPAFRAGRRSTDAPVAVMSATSDGS
jgi:cellulose synthase (UDP-forming)